MKTVQEHLKNADRGRLIDAYLDKYPVNLHELGKEYDDLTIEEAKTRNKKKLGQFINHLVQLEVKAPDDGRVYFLVAHASMKDGIKAVDTSLFCLEEVLQRECPDTYGYAFSSHAEVMGYYIVDNEYTQKNLLIVLADMLHEASFFGMKQQDLEEFVRKLEEARQTPVEECISWEDLMTKMKLKYEHLWDEQSELETEVLDAVYKFNRESIECELEKFRENYGNKE